MKLVGNIICVTVSISWFLSITAFMLGVTAFMLVRGARIEHTLFLGMFTIGMIIAFGVVFHNKLIDTRVFITSVIAFLATLGILVCAYFGMLAVA